MTKPTLPTEWNEKTAKQVRDDFERWYEANSLNLNPAAKYRAYRCLCHLRVFAWNIHRGPLPRALTDGVAEDFAELERLLSEQR